MNQKPAKVYIDQDPILSMLMHINRFDHLKTRYVLVRSDISRFHSLINESMRINGGTFLNLLLSDERLPDNIPNIIPEDKLRIISEFSKQLHIADVKSSEAAYFSFIPKEEKRLEVKVITKENGETEEGRPLEGQNVDRTSILATILISPILYCFDGHQMVGLIYNPDPLDPTNQEKLNEYFCNVIREKLSDTSLIIFLQTRELEDTWFVKPIELLGALEADEFIKIMPSSETVKNIPQCAVTIKKESPVIFFLGSGCSAQAGIPMGPELCRIALEQLLSGSKEDSTKTLVKRFWTHVKVHGHWLPGEQGGYLTTPTFERVISEQFAQHARTRAPTIEYLSNICKDKSPSIGHEYLADIIAAGFRILIITSNYDTLVEQSIRSHGLDSILIIDEDSAEKHSKDVISYLRGETKAIPIIKIHGTIDSLKTISASVEDTTRLTPAMEKILLKVLKEEDHKEVGIPECVPIIFSGYSFRDADIYSVLQRTDVLKGMDEWIVDPLIRGGVTNFISLDRSGKTERPTDISTRIIYTKFDLFLHELRDLLVSK